MEKNSFQSFYDQLLSFFHNLFGLKPTDKEHSGLQGGESDHTIQANNTGEGHNQAHVHTDQHSHENVSSNEQVKLEAQNTNSLASLDLNLFHKIDTLIGAGAEAFAGADVSVHYTGWLIDTNASDLKGAKFDSSVDRGQTFNFPLGAGHVIRGWDEGFAGMKIGGKRTLLIPPEMGYGARGAGGVIPPNANLMFEVELLGVE